MIVQHVDMATVDGVLDRLQEVRLGRVLEGAEDVETDERCAGSHALDADVAGGRIGLRAETLDVVSHQALARDGVRIQKGLVAAGRMPRSVAGKSW